MSNVLSRGLLLTGIHHVSARTKRIGVNHDFYTRVLNLRLVKKSVNQDDTRMYHLFYADRIGTPGSGMTFFDLPLAAPEHKGNNSITRTTFRVTGETALSFWADRLTAEKVEHSGVVVLDGRLHLHFEDPDGTPLSLVEDGGKGPRGVVRLGNGEPSEVPEEFQIQGLGYGGITVADLAPTRDFLERGLNLLKVRQYQLPPQTSPSGTEAFTVHVFEMGAERDAGPHAEVHVAVRTDLPRFRPGAGGVHHIALRVPDEIGIEAWLEHLDKEGFQNTGLIDRFYFHSVYLKEPHGIVIELATDGPGFHADEPVDQLGEELALPPFLEDQRAEIESHLKPIISQPMRHD
jgi:glyoxalase family protein